jgi:hypothetical protein
MSSAEAEAVAFVHRQAIAREAIATALADTARHIARGDLFCAGTRLQESAVWIARLTDLAEWHRALDLFAALYSLGLSAEREAKR